MKRILYFAYGSNLLTRRLEFRVGKIKEIGIHILQDYKLTFDCESFANIQPSAGDAVEGYLYELNSTQLRELTTYEGFYNMEFFDVGITNSIGVVYTGKELVVEKGIRLGVLSPTREYLRIILEGCIEKKLKRTAISIANLLKLLPVPLKKKKLKRKVA